MGRPLLPEEKAYHINCLELLTASFAFLEVQKDKQVFLLLDIQTAVAYVNNPVRLSLSKE